jgi:hypothetical protein
MERDDFFSEIEHREVPWGQTSIAVPIFYRDVMSLGALFLASTARLRALLPSSRMHPLRITPWHGILSVSVNQFRDSDLGPYNEVAVSVPFTLDKASPMFVGLLHNTPEEPSLYIHSLPVTTEIALDAGVEFAGYPKFLAGIEFQQEADWVSCRLVEGDRHIFTLAGRRVDLQEAPRLRMHVFTTRNGRLLRSQLICSERGRGVSRDPSHVRLELGDHPLAQELRGVRLGRMLTYQYEPQYQTILTPVLESFGL